MCVLSHFSCVQLYVTLWTVALQAPLTKGYSRQEYWRGLASPPPGELPNPGIKSMSPVVPAFEGAKLPGKPPLLISKSGLLF